MSDKKKLSHVESDGRLCMVDVGAKDVTRRQAIANCHIKMATKTIQLLRENSLQKGDALNTAKVAGIMAAKRTAELIPLCHMLLLSKVDIAIEIKEQQVNIESMVLCEGKTGVEMEALTACSVAALTIYDMCKAVDKNMIIGELKLVHKSGGKSGDFNLQK
ncbi:MAG: cyclic pyranopterin monophosphate synthase MoaC [Deferribacteres bacterium]|nr:cyclic pyranopterin monophosphate synthase MoaC [candidate division KSB1 bacterium]MCB9501433.1 cyclic pyranopterin monophosphate synthase MoaC [Deferribacteres bacterium]